jgi:hypothetical protein
MIHECGNLSPFKIKLDDLHIDGDGAQRGARSSQLSSDQMILNNNSGA